ncbi:hypothetical protein ABDZ57_15860 [Aeromonas veronii]|uniref:hypothetical protein n=2 Tax=Aeromonas veronii TaxID=654 RepID=UPI0031FBCD95
MNANLLSPENDANSDDVVISFPVPKSSLGDFVTSLLGQKQSLERTYSINFEINHAWLVNLHEIIDQRVHQQARAQLANFTAVVYFEGGTKRTISTIDAFKGYFETKLLVSVGVKITWSYLVEFPNKPYPESQQISLTAFTKVKKTTNSKDTVESLFEDFVSSRNAYLNIQIDHTERTWGDDIEGIITNCIDDIEVKISAKERIVRYSRPLLALIITFLMILYPLYSNQTINGDVAEQLIEAYQPLADSKNVKIELINKKVDLIFNGVANFEKNKNTSEFKLIICIFLLPIVSAFFLGLTKQTTQSFILLTKKTEDLKKRADEKNNKKVTIVALAYLASIIAGILANYGYKWVSAIL